MTAARVICLSGPAPYEKIFPYFLAANHRRNPPNLSREEGTLATSLTLGQAAVDALVSQDVRRQCVRRNRVVLTPREQASSFREVCAFRGRWCQKAGHQGEHGIGRQTIAQGRPECFRRTCLLVCVSFVAHCTRDRGCGAHPVFPAPSKVSRCNEFCKARAKGV